MKTFLTVLIGMLLILNSCKTDEDRIKEANSIIEKFAKEISLENFSAANQIYPKFSELDKYWKLNDFKIDNTIIEEDGSISIYGSYQKYSPKFREDVKFIISDKGQGLKITDSKGLTTYYNSPIFEYCKKKGFLKSSGEKNSIDSDISIAKTCKEHEFEFDFLVMNCARYVNENVTWNKQQTTIESGYLGDSYSGTISIVNNTGFDLNNNSFDFKLYWFNGEVQTDEHKIQFLYNIRAYSTVNHKILYESLPSRARKYSFAVSLNNQESFAAEVVRKLDYAESL
jgi:hypothetical protein